LVVVKVVVAVVLARVARCRYALLDIA